MRLHAAGPLPVWVEIPEPRKDGTEPSKRSVLKRASGAEVDGYQPGVTCGADANALILLNRLAFPQANGQGSHVQMDNRGEDALLAWASTTYGNQGNVAPAKLSMRRERLVQDLRNQGWHVLRLLLRPEWRIAIGHGSQDNPHEIGLTLHGTLGCPIIPSSSIKGLLVSHVSAHVGEGHRQSSGVLDDEGRVWSLGPRPDEERIKAPLADQVHILDAIPCVTDPHKVKNHTQRRLFELSADVLTPHARPYYNAAAHGESPTEPPAEHHNPVPVGFLTVRSSFEVVLYGQEADWVDSAAEQLADAGTELGVGARTNAGYGYFTVEALDDVTRQHFDEKVT